MLGGQSEKLHLNAVSVWHNGAQQEATLLLLQAAQSNPDDGLLLNNLAAFLNMGGAPNKAVPILKNLSVSYPENSFVLNNLGQSYANLGEADTSMYYLKRCLKIAPMHASANHTAGVIEVSKGNTTVAEVHFTKAVKASKNPKSIAALKKIKPEVVLIKLAPPNIKLADYFNPYKYQLPQQCSNVNDAIKAEQEHLDFDNWMTRLQEAYVAIRDNEDEQGINELKVKAANIKQNMAAYANVKKDFKISPFAYYGNWMWVSMLPYLNDMAADADKFVQEKEKLIEARTNAWALEIDKYYSNDHAAIDAASNRCLQDVSEMRKAIQVKLLLVAKLKFENYAYWRYLGSVNKQLANGAFDDAARMYLADLQKMAKTHVIRPSGSDFGDLEPRIKEEDKLAKMDCPFNININLIVGKIKLDCEKFIFSGGEGLKFKYEKESESGASSINIGIGLGFDAGRGSIVEAGGSINLDQSLYITFDGENNITDVGMEMNAGVSVEAGFKGGGETIQIDKGFTDGGINAGYRIGINSGINFTGNALKMLN